MTYDLYMFYTNYVFSNFNKVYLKSTKANDKEIFNQIQFFDIFANNIHIHEYYDNFYNNVISKGKTGKYAYYKLVNDLFTTETQNKINQRFPILTTHIKNMEDTLKERYTSHQ